MGGLLRCPPPDPVGGCTLPAPGLRSLAPKLAPRVLPGDQCRHLRADFLLAEYFPLAQSRLPLLMVPQAGQRAALRAAEGAEGEGRRWSQRRRERELRFGGLLRCPPLILWAAAHLLLLDCAGSTSHSLRYFHTAVSEPGQGLPQFIAVGYVDDQQIDQYDSDTKEDLPRVPWIRKVEKEDPQYWKEETQKRQGDELTSRVNLQTLRNRYNQSGGIHTLQYMYGCELGPDGRKGGHLQYSYDGRDFIAFDKETLTWTAAVTEAQVSKRKWDPIMAMNHRYKAYLEEECIDWLQRYLDYGKETLHRTEALVVKVTRKADYDGLETLVCQVHGFYPKEIEANWVKDGEVWLEGTSRGLVAPNSDGTYYVLLSVKIDPEERDRFRCRVEHDSLEKPLDVAWEKPLNLGLIVGAILGVVGAVLLVSGIVFFIRRKRSENLAYKAASTSDQGSDSSTKASYQPGV